MKTIVETFLVEETESLIYDNEKLERWNALVAELQLAGQQTIVKPDKSPIPFMVLNQSTRNIIGTLCPSEVAIENYNRTPIPVELLDLVALSKKENYFDKIVICYDEKTSDPFVIGQVGIFEVVSWSTKPHFMIKNQYLIGKWGDVRRSWNELKEMAVKRFRSERTTQLTDELKRVKRALEDVDLDAVNQFGHGEPGLV